MAMLDDAQLASMRAVAEETFSDFCVINEPAAAPVFDPNTGTYTPGTAGAQVYSGACAVAPTQGSDRVVEVGGDVVTLRTFTVRVPWDTTGVKVDHVVTVTTTDPHMTGRPLRVLDVQGRTTPIERVLVVEDSLG